VAILIHDADALCALLDELRARGVSGVELQFSGDTVAGMKIIGMRPPAPAVVPAREEPPRPSRIPAAVRDELEAENAGKSETKLPPPGLGYR